MCSPQGRSLASAVVVLLASACVNELGGDSPYAPTGVTENDSGVQDAGIYAPADAGQEMPEPFSLRIAVVSDLNGTYGSTSYESTVHGAVADIVAEAPDLVLSTGDMVAGQRKGLNYAAMWSAFHTAVSTPFANAGIPFAVSPGNHDASGYSDFVGERAVYESEWLVRKPALDFVDDTNFPFRYSFKVGQAFFIALDATTIGNLSPGQVNWIVAQLEAHKDMPFKFVFGHVPLYAFSPAKDDETIDDPSLESIMNMYGVTAWLSGHHHAYYPGKRGDLRFVGMPCLGGGSRALYGSASVSPRGYVMIELDDTGIRLLEGYRTPDFMTAIARSELPPQIGLGAGVITRDDL